MRVVQIEPNNIVIEKEVSGFKLNISLNLWHTSMGFVVKYSRAQKVFVHCLMRVCMGMRT
jgi:hypothetical protein